MSEKPTYEELERRIGVLEERIRKAEELGDTIFESREKFRALADLTPIALMLYQNDRWISINKAAEIMTGYSVGELLAMNFWEIIHPDYRVFVREWTGKRQAGEERAEGHEFKILTKDGTEKWASLTGVPAMIGGQPAGLISVVDITERKRAETAHLEEEAKYRALFENANDAIFLLSGERIIDCNRKTLEMFGCTMEQLIGESLYGFSPLFQSGGLDSKQEALEKITSALNGEPQFFSWRHCRYNRSVFDSEVSLNRIVLKQETLIQVIVRDVTERKQNEEKLQKLVLELESALTKVKMLTGFLPICASCKKIRNDDGYWEQIEEYISQHSEALFSHGICPDCARKLYPQMFKSK